MKTSRSAKRIFTSPEETNEEQASKLLVARAAKIAAARANLGVRLASTKRPFRHVVYGKGGSIEAVTCKLCGTKIVGLVEDERYETKERVNKQLVIYKRLVPAHLPNYRELRLYFDDQSAHITHCCAACTPKVLEDLTLAEECYKHDLAQWAEDERRGLGAVRWDKVTDRQIVSVEEVQK